MSPTRRDVIKYATAAAFLTALPASDRADAMRSLEIPVSDNPTLDPGTFAGDAHVNLATYDDIWYTAIAPEEWVALRQSRDRLEALIPALGDRPGHRAIWDAYCEVDANLTSLIMEAHRAGLRQGARFEQLRQSLVNDTAECRTCWGHGLCNGATCTTCSGKGVVAFADGRDKR